MRTTVHPGGFRGGETAVPGDKSVAHRWLILAGIGQGRSELRGLPEALDVRSTARCVAALLGGSGGAALEGWASQSGPVPDGDRSTTNRPRPRGGGLAIEAQGRGALQPPGRSLEGGNSGTTMRLLAGGVAREPLRTVGAEVTTTDGHAPLRVRGGRLRGIEYVAPVPTAQVKSAVLLAGLEADGETTVRESGPTRDHTERALEHLGAPIRSEAGSVRVAAFRPPGFSGSVPGDVSSAAFLLAAAALTGRALTVREVGLNPTRTGFIGVLARMGVRTRLEVEREELGEPGGSLLGEACDGLRGTTVG